MKKLITLLFVFPVLLSQAQITITSNDMPSANDTVRLSNTVDIWGLDPTATGANYVWDYGFIAPVSQQLDTFFTVSSTPFPYQFYFNNNILYPEHKATFARPGIEFDLFGTVTMTNVFDFFKTETARFSNVGFGSNINGIPASTRNIPVDTIYKFPLNYSDTYTSEAKWLLNVPSLAAYGQTKYRSAEVEGWGTLITPFGTFQTLKVRMDIDITDTLSVDSLGINFSFPRPTATEYHWLAAGMKIPVLQINTTAGFITSIQYQDSLRTSFIGINETELDQPSVYPNPATEQIVINTNGKALIEKISVFNMSGQVVMTQKGYNLPMTLLDVSSLANGIYFLSVESEKGTTQSKITISR